MKIRFYHKDTGNLVSHSDAKDFLFVMNNKVYADNCKSVESSSSVVNFEDFIEERPDLKWIIEGDNQ